MGRDSGCGIQDTTKSRRRLTVRKIRTGESAAAYGDDDFKRIAVGKHFLRMTAARHDFTVTLERDAFARKFQVLEQFAAVERAFETVSFAVDGQCDHNAI
jgi:hypothetical protein